MDRDGTLIVDKDYLHKPGEVEFFPGALAACSAAQKAGFLLVLVTNQSGVGRGYFTMADVEQVHDHIRFEAEKAGAEFSDIYTAPEAPDQPSRGRKPSPQFLFDARDKHGIDLSNSYMVGDKLIDLECGWNAGVKESFLVRTGYGSKVEKSGQDLRGSKVFDSIKECVDHLIKK
ncbi:MAG: histidinol-phosphate phosphatase, HAD-superfamily hydrolase subfamily [Verrucomicrobiales bacterium]|nr:histidinol-phosphate phosphatase, HAD-superfamily hydrolase subfamily [Verrucomicrobiales bacterium]